MRKLVLVLLAALVLGGAAYAQSGFYAALSAGYPGAAVHFGVEDIGVEGLDARLNVGYAYIGGDFAVGLDALYAIDLGTMEMDAPIEVYVGGGVGYAGGIALKALVGGSYSLAEVTGVDGLGVFLEAGPTYTFAVDRGINADARLGVSYGF